MPESIKDGVYAQVSGTVGRVADGRFTIEVKTERSQYPDYVTVWGADFAAAKGDRISVKGWFSWKKTEKDGKTYIDTSVNQPVKVAIETAAAAAPSEEEIPF